MFVDYDERMDTQTPARLHQILKSIRLRLAGTKYDYELITGQSRRQDVMLLRHVLVYYLRHDRRLVYSQIGYMLRRDHTTVINSVAKGEQYVEFYRNTTALDFYKLIRGENGK